MKYVMAVTVLALVACGGTKNRAPANEPVSTTQTTSAALTTTRSAQVEARDDQGPNAPIIATTEKDRALGGRIRHHLQRSLKDVAWNRVRMEIDGGQVKLVGTLPTVADSIAVEECVREVKGVMAVTNEIKLPAGTEQ